MGRRTRADRTPASRGPQAAAGTRPGRPGRRARRGRRWGGALLAVVVPGLLALAPAPAPVAGSAGGDGGPAPDVRRVSTRIVGGSDAPPGAWPNQVAVLRSTIANSFSALRCGGTLLNRSWVLTAAHCVDPGNQPPYQPADLHVLTGTQNLSAGGTRLPVAEIRVVSGWDPGTNERDVALLRLGQPAAAAGQPLIGQGGTVPAGADVVATGWGTLSAGGSRPAQLQQVTMPFRSDGQCTAAHGSYYQASSMVCAGAAGLDTCQGDSGGPLLRAQGDSWVQVGVTSWGEGCGDGAYPGVYAKVAAFSNWIKAQVRYGPHSDAAAFLNRAYRDLYDRLPTGAEVAAGTQAFHGSTTPAAYVSARIVDGPYQSRTGGVARLYRAYFLRDPDGPGLAYWWKQVNGGRSLGRISNMFAASAEFQARYGSLGNAAFVELVYQNVLGRPAEPAGLAFWRGQLDSGHRTRGQVMVGFSESAEFKAQHRVRLDVLITSFALLRRLPTPSELGTWMAQSNPTLVTGLLASQEYASRF